MAEKAKKDYPVTIRLDQQTYTTIENISLENDSTMSYEIRKMINYYLKSKEMIEK